MSSLTFEKIIYSKFFKKYSYKKFNYTKIALNLLIFNKSSHLVSNFKDYMIWDFIDEFLKRYYTKNESLIRIPKFAAFYLNYLVFFCKPTFSYQKYNNIIQYYSEKKAEIFPEKPWPVIFANFRTGFFKKGLLVKRVLKFNLSESNDTEEAENNDLAAS